jgi:hypothetical protein
MEYNYLNIKNKQKTLKYYSNKTSRREPLSHLSYKISKNKTLRKTKINQLRSNSKKINKTSSSKPLSSKPSNNKPSSSKPSNNKHSNNKPSTN